MIVALKSLRDINFSFLGRKSGMQQFYHSCTWISYEQTSSTKYIVKGHAKLWLVYKICAHSVLLLALQCITDSPYFMFKTVANYNNRNPHMILVTDTQMLLWISSRLSLCTFPNFMDAIFIAAFASVPANSSHITYSLHLCWLCTTSDVCRKVSTLNKMPKRRRTA